MNHNQKAELILSIVTVLIIAVISGCVENEEQKKSMQNNSLQNATQNTTQNIKNVASIQAPKNITIKVIKFEPNNPCQGCTNLGNYAEETIKIYFPVEYKSGKITSGELKEIACNKMEKFMNNFVKGIEKARKQIDKLKFVKFK